MTRHPCHWVFVGLTGRFAREDVDLGIVGHHALVHAVESQPLSIGTPEGAFLNAKLIAVDTLAVDDLTTAVC